MRAGRRLRAWQQAGHIRRNAEEIIVTPSVTEPMGVSVTPEATVTGRSMTVVKIASFIVALALGGLFHRWPDRDLCRSFLARHHHGRHPGGREARRRSVVDRELVLCAIPSAPDTGGDDRSVDAPERRRGVRVPYKSPPGPHGDRRYGACGQGRRQ